METINSLRPGHHLFRDSGWNVDSEKEEEFVGNEKQAS
jgi:hypothetical protein